MHPAVKRDRNLPPGWTIRGPTSFAEGKIKGESGSWGFIVRSTDELMQLSEANRVRQPYLQQEAGMDHHQVMLYIA